MKKLATAIMSAFLGATVATFVAWHAKPLLSTDGLTVRFHAPTNCINEPPRGYVRVLYRKYDANNTFGGCGWFLATPSESRWVLDSFDAWESIPGVVTYRSTGNYPNYIQRVVKGTYFPEKLGRSGRRLAETSRSARQGNGLPDFSTLFLSARTETELRIVLRYCHVPNGKGSA